MIKFILLCFLLFSSFQVFSMQTITLTDRNSVVLDLEFNFDNVNEVLKEFHDKINRKLGFSVPFKQKDLYLVLISPGGSIEAGLMLIDNLKSLGYNVHTITVFAASMGFITAQSLNTRYITEHGQLMSHRARGGMSGQFPNGELGSRYSYWLNRLMKVDENVVNRTGNKYTVKEYRQMIMNEYWCEGIDCVNDGFADQVVRVKCDKTLYGEKTRSFNLNVGFGSVNFVVGRSECPVFYGYKLVKAELNGKDYNFDNIMLNQLINNKIKEINNVGKRKQTQFDY